MNGKNIFIAGIVMVLIIASYLWFFVYNKAHVDYEKEKPAISGTPDEIYGLALEDIDVFNKNFLNKAVEVEGSVEQVEGSTLIFSPGLFLRMADENNAVMGDLLKIKGRYVGSEEDILTGELILHFDQCRLVE